MLFRRLAVFAGGCTLEAAEAVGAVDPGGPGTDILDGLAVLVDESLLRPEPGPDGEPRFGMLETIREYGLERLAAAGEAEAVAARHAAFFLALAERDGPALGGPQAPACLARLEREDDNLRAALRWAEARGEWTLALRLAGALWPYWAQRGHLSEGRRWLRAALDAPESGAGDPAARAKALAGAAQLAVDQGAYEEAARRCAQAVALARRRGARRDLVAALNTRGLLARMQARYAAAVRDHEAALPLARAADDRAGEAAALVGLAYAAMSTGAAARAGALAEEGLAVMRALGDARGLAEALHGLAWQATHAGRYERARALNAEALALFRALGDTGQTAEALRALGTVAELQEAHELAVAYLEESLALHRSRGDARGIALVLAALGASALNRGDRARSQLVLEEALALARRHDDRWTCAMPLALLGHVALAGGDVARAHERFAEGAALMQATGNLLYLSWCLEGLADLAARRARHDRAAQLVGARDALRERVASLLPPAHPVGYAGTLTALRGALTEEAFAAAAPRARAGRSRRSSPRRWPPRAGVHPKHLCGSFRSYQEWWACRNFDTAGELGWSAAHAAGASARKAAERVAAKGRSSHQAPRRRTLSAVAVRTCCRWVLARPM